MIQDIQEYLQHWEKENNPFYPSEMRWDRLQVNRLLKDYKRQLILPVVGNHVFCPHCGDKRQLKVETDLNSERVCKSALCKGK